MTQQENPQGAPTTDGRLLGPLEVDPEFIYEITVPIAGTENKTVIAYLLVVSPIGDLLKTTEFWLLKKEWSENRPGEYGAKSWTFNPAARADNSDSKLRPYPVFKNASEAIIALKTFGNWADTDVMRKHTVEAL